MKSRILVVGALVLSCALHGQSVPDSSGINKKRLRTTLLVAGTVYTGSMIALHQIWYKEDSQSDFHFFNDNDEWMQVDKVGHAFTSFYLSYGASKGLQWCGVPKKKSDLWGTAAGFALMLPIEIMDGFSEDYGASPGDLIANASGALFYLGQTALWKEPRIYPKFSYHSTPYPDYRPDVLGDTWYSQVIKDYNGQTYWLSVDLDKFLRFPRWLNIAVGYGAEEMVYATEEANLNNGFTPYRQLYFALDPDLTAIRSKSKVVNTLIFFVNMIKLPAPTVEFSSRGTQFHWFYQ